MRDTPSPVQLAWGSIVLLAYFCFGIWGMVLERRAERFRTRPAASRRARWVADDFAPEGRRLVALNRRWERWSWAAWLGGAALIWAGALLPG